MASHADINPLKLSKIVINKFIHLNYVDLTFEKFTSINGKNKSMQGKNEKVPESERNY